MPRGEVKVHPLLGFNPGAAGEHVLGEARHKLGMWPTMRFCADYCRYSARPKIAASGARTVGGPRLR